MTDTRHPRTAPAVRGHIHAVLRHANGREEVVADQPNAITSTGSTYLTRLLARKTVSDTTNTDTFFRTPPSHIAIGDGLVSTTAGIVAGTPATTQLVREQGRILARPTPATGYRLVPSATVTFPDLGAGSGSTITELGWFGSWQADGLTPAATYTAGTAAQSGTTVTGSGIAAWTSAMIGSYLTYTGASNGAIGGTVLGVTDSTHLTVSTSQTISGQSYSLALPAGMAWVPQRPFSQTSYNTTTTPAAAAAAALTWGTLTAATASGGTVLTDTTKNWTGNAYAGTSLWYPGALASIPTGSAPWIVSNTATTLTLASPVPALVAQGTQYRIDYGFTGAAPLLRKETGGGKVFPDIANSAPGTIAYNNPAGSTAMTITDLKQWWHPGQWIGWTFYLTGAGWAPGTNKRNAWPITGNTETTVTVDPWSATDDINDAATYCIGGANGFLGETTSPTAWPSWSSYLFAYAPVNITKTVGSSLTVTWSVGLHASDLADT